MLEREVLEIEADSVALCFYERENWRTGRNEIQAKRFDRESGITRYYKPFGGQTVSPDEMWLCRVGETVFTRREDVVVVEEIVLVAPLIFLGHKRGQPIHLELERVSGQWRSTVRNHSRSDSVTIVTDYVLDRQSKHRPAAGLVRYYYVTKLVSWQRRDCGWVSLVVAVDLEPPAVKWAKAARPLAEVA